MSKKTCNANNTHGEPCRAFASESGFCFMHDSMKVEEREAARRSGGFSTKRPHAGNSSLVPSQIQNLDGVLAVLDYVLQESIILDNSIQRGRLLVAIAHGFVETLKVGELEKRLEALETALGSKR